MLLGKEPPFAEQWGRVSDVAPVLLEQVQASVGYIIVVSKGMASGLPISAAFADDEVAASWGPGATWAIATTALTRPRAGAAGGRMGLIAGYYDNTGCLYMSGQSGPAPPGGSANPAFAGISPICAPERSGSAPQRQHLSQNGEHVVLVVH
jgi:hypothetical protein